MSCLLVLAALVRLGAAGELPLIDAVKDGDSATVRALLGQHADVTTAEPDGTTALHWAAERDQVETARLLLDAGAEPSAANRYGVTPLQLAAVNGNPVMVEVLLAAGADPNATLPEGETVLMSAARTGTPEVLELLLDHGADIHAREHFYGETALMWAAAEDHPEAVTVLVTRGAHPDTRSVLQDFDNRRSGQSVLSLGAWTSLMYAARQNAVAAGAALIEAGASLDAVDPDGATALVIAIINAHYEFATMLVEAGADPDVVDTAAGMGPLYAAADMHRLAVGHGRPNPRPVGPLDAADVVEALLAHGANPNIRLTGVIMQRQHTFGDFVLGKGATPFMRAAKSGDVEVMRLLLDAGADATLTMPDGTTPLMFAAGRGWRDGSPAAPSFDQGTVEEAVEAVGLLLDLGLDVNAAADSGDTALHMAVSGRGAEPIVRYLVERGADVHATNARGQTPLDVAKSSRRDRSAIAAFLQEVAGAPADTAVDTAADAGAVVSRYCVTCHSERAAAGGVVIEGLDLTDVATAAPVWERAIRKLRMRSMPPPGVPRPDESSYQTLIAHLEDSLDEAAARNPDPGRASIHRLNRAEYANAVRDLLGVEMDGAALLPPDESIDGFDNNADGLSLSPVLLERYLSAAAQVSALAVGSPTLDASSATYRVPGDASQTSHIEGLPLGTRGGVRADHWFPQDGEYVIKIKLLETNLGSLRGLVYENQLEISIDGERVLLAPVGGAEDFVASPANARNVLEAIEARTTARVHVKAGPRTVVAAFLDKTAAQMPDRLQAFERSTLVATDYLGLPHVESLTILGPFEAAPPTDTPSRQRIFVCQPDGQDAERPCAEQIIRRLARRAYHRPVTDADVEPLLAFYEQGAGGGGFEAGVTRAIRALLVSPRFLFRTEPEPDAPDAGAPSPIGDLALASRLSFFLWSSIPDDELLDLATAGRLGQPAVLEAQVRRMLADNRAQALIDNFAGQWLQLRNLRSTEPDKNIFPDFDDNLRRAFGREAELFVQSIATEDRSILDLLTARDTFVNERLARHYGIPHVYGSQFRRVTVDDDARAGLLGKGALLLITSHPDRTSPVVRGKWVLENLLGSPPPPPPAVVPALEEASVGADATMRERMVAHRQNPVCAACHRLMDPIGLALENFDAVGKWRDTEGGRPIDTSGQLTDGTAIDGVATLREALLARSDVFLSTVTEKLLTYALGRRVRAADMPAVRAIVREAEDEDYRFSALVLGIVNSVPFRYQAAERVSRAGQAAQSHPIAESAAPAALARSADDERGDGGGVPVARVGVGPHAP